MKEINGIEPLDRELAKIARDAAVLRAAACGITTEDAFNRLIESIKKHPENIQRMIDIIVDMQKDFPMPKEGWETFVRDINYTNKKHGWNLHTKGKQNEKA